MVSKEVTFAYSIIGIAMLLMVVLVVSNVSNNSRISTTGEIVISGDSVMPGTTIEEECIANVPENFVSAQAYSLYQNSFEPGDDQTQVCYVSDGMCKGFCNNEGNIGIWPNADCYCADDCLLYDFCCPGFVKTCLLDQTKLPSYKNIDDNPDSTPSGTGSGSNFISSESCSGNCGGMAESGCFCDEFCDGFGDCCEDKGSVC